jgi:uncharacterized protein YdcH (DUF465 family)
MPNNKHFVEFADLEEELGVLIKEMADEFQKVDPAKEVGEITIEMAEEFSTPYADRFVARLRELETEFDEHVVREHFKLVIEEFDTVDRAVYAKTDEQEPTQGIAVLVAEHKTQIMQMLQEKDEGYDG